MSVPQPSRWCSSRGKRIADIGIAAAALLCLAPAMAIIAAAVLIASGPPALFRQKRTGLNGREFVVFKFRTMRNENSGSGVTQANDRRVTRLGRLLRASKLDELPQLVNIIRGDMSLVGPRPDLPELWRLADPESRRVLELRPGVTGAASLRFREEELFLATVAPDQLTTHYVKVQLPTKAAIDWQYARQASFLSDCRLLLETILPFAFKKYLPADARRYDPISR